MLCVLLFESLDLVLLHVNGAEYEIHLLRDLVYILLGVKNGELADLLGHGGLHSPLAADGVLELLACRAGGSRYANHVEPGVLG